VKFGERDWFSQVAAVYEEEMNSFEIPRKEGGSVNLHHRAS
jgi:hypothetical protein